MPELQVYVVEVCRGCDWNLLVEQYLLGTGWAEEPPEQPVRPMPVRERRRVQA